MGTIDDIKKLEEQLREAELAPDPDFFARILDDHALLDGQRLKSQIVAAHRPGVHPKFTRVEMSDYQIQDHGDAAVVTCQGIFENSKGTFKMKFMRVWHKREGQWRVIAGTTAMLP